MEPLKLFQGFFIMKDYKFTCMPKNLVLAMDANCTRMFFTLLQYSDYTSSSDGWFSAPNSILQTQAGMSKNLVIVTLDTLYQAGVIDIECDGVGSRKTNRIKILEEKMEEYDGYTVDEIITTPGLGINTLPYQNNYKASYSQGKKECKKYCKKLCKKMNTIIDNIDNIKNIDNIDNTIDISNKNINKEKSLVLDITTKEERNPKKEESPVAGEEEFESREEIIDKYYKYIVKTLPVLEKDRCTGLTDEDNFSPDTLTWAEEQDFGFIYNLFRNWESGGREKFTEIVQGCSTTPAIFDIIFYSLHTIKCMNTARA